MRAILRRFLDWLDKRFPPKVVVTLAEMEAIAEKLYKHKQSLESLHDTARGLADRLEGLEKAKPFDLTVALDRIEAIEARQAEIAKMLAAPKKSESEVLREQFVRGEFPRNLTRSAVEKAK